MDSKAKQSNSDVPEDRYDLRVLKSLRQIMRAVSMHSRRLIKEHKITSPQLLCLMNVVESGELTVASIAKRVYLSPSTVVGILDRLEEKGLIERNRSKTDRRVVHVSATKTGIEFSKNAPSPLQDTLAQAMSELTELEQATISLSLERVVHLMGLDDMEVSPILDHESINSSS